MRSVSGCMDVAARAAPAAAVRCMIAANHAIALVTGWAVHRSSHTIHKCDAWGEDAHGRDQSDQFLTLVLVPSDRTAVSGQLTNAGRCHAPPRRRVRGCAKLVKLAAAMLNELHAQLRDAWFQHVPLRRSTTRVQPRMTFKATWACGHASPTFKSRSGFPRELLLALTVSGINGRRPFRPAIGHAG